MIPKRNIISCVFDVRGGDRKADVRSTHPTFHFDSCRPRTNFAMEIVGGAEANTMPMVVGSDPQEVLGDDMERPSAIRWPTNGRQALAALALGHILGASALPMVLCSWLTTCCPLLRWVFVRGVLFFLA